MKNTILGEQVYRVVVYQTKNEMVGNEIMYCYECRVVCDTVIAARLTVDHGLVYTTARNLTFTGDDAAKRLVEIGNSICIPANEKLAGRPIVFYFDVSLANASLNEMQDHIRKAYKNVASVTIKERPTDIKIDNDVLEHIRSLKAEGYHREAFMKALQECLQLGESYDFPGLSEEALREIITMWDYAV